MKIYILVLLVFCGVHAMDETGLYVNERITKVHKRENNKEIIYEALRNDSPFVRWECRQNKKTGAINCRTCYFSKNGANIGSVHINEKLFEYILHKYNQQKQK